MKSQPWPLVSVSLFIVLACLQDRAKLHVEAFSLTKQAFASHGRCVGEIRIKSSRYSLPTTESILIENMQLGQASLSSDCDGVADNNGDTQDSSDSHRTWKDDGFVFGLESSGLKRPKGRTSQIVVEGDSTETKSYQQVMVALTFTGHAWFLLKAFEAMIIMATGSIALAAGQALLLTLLSWVLADFGSGVLHWSVDNYGNGKTPIMGSIIAAFQGHHSAPWTITERAFCNNVYKLCIPFGLPSMVVIQFLAGGPGPTSWFFATFCIFEILSQEFHKWSHQLPSQTPSWVNWLQKVGLTVGRAPHALHHKAPFEGNYCIISGICNKPLDEFGVFRRMERLIYTLNKVEPNVWKLDPTLREKTLRGDYRIST